MALALTEADSPRINALVRRHFAALIASSRMCLGVVATLPNTHSFTIDPATDFDPPPFPEMQSLSGNVISHLFTFLATLSSGNDPLNPDVPFYVTLPTAWYDPGTATIKSFFNYIVPTAEEYLAGTFEQ